MTKLFNDPARFTEDMLVGFLDANARYVSGVPGGVVRAHNTRPGKVAVVIGGGSGHYPAFCGTVGPGSPTAPWSATSSPHRRPRKPRRCRGLPTVTRACC